MKYRAQVTKVNKKNGTIKVKCPNVWGNQESPWCYPCIPFMHKAYTLYPPSGEDMCTGDVDVPETEISIPGASIKLPSISIPGASMPGDEVTGGNKPSTDLNLGSVAVPGSTTRVPGRSCTVSCKPKCNLKIIVRLPKVGENVWIEFEQDDTMSTPIYVGTWGDDEFWKSVWLED